MVSVQRAVLAAIAFAVATACLFARPAFAQDVGKKEQAARERVAAALGELAEWCTENEAEGLGRTVFSELRALDPSAAEPYADTFGEADPDDDEGGDPESGSDGRRRLGPQIAKAYDKLFAVKHDGSDEARARFDGYLEAALRWDPTKSRVKKAVQCIKKAEDDELRAARLVARYHGASGELGGPIAALAVSRASDGPLLLASAKHELVGWVWLPRTWKKGRSYPVLIGVDGAGANHKGYGAKSVSARGSRPVIVLAPVTLSNTNSLSPKKYSHYSNETLEGWGGKRLEFDGPGVDGLLGEIEALFGGDQGLFLTGFSGGGVYTYWKLIHDPERVLGAVPCCANFANFGSDDVAQAKDGGPPVLILTGENDKHREFTHGNKDSPGIEPQTDNAVKVLADNGFTRVERRMVKAGHSPLHDMVWEFVDEVLEGARGAAPMGR